MALEDDLRAIADSANRDLDAVNDFFEHSKFVWLSFQTLVDAGHRVQTRNLATGTTIDQDGLLRLASHYQREYLTTLTFRQFVSTFEMFLFRFLHRLLLHNPRQFGQSPVPFEVVLNARDREEIISGVILKQLNDLKYEQLREWFTALNKAVKLGCPTKDEIDRLAEIKATRDVLEHNAGVVNETYVRKAGRKARYAPGDHVEVDDTYHLESWQLMKKVVADIAAASVSKLARRK